MPSSTALRTSKNTAMLLGATFVRMGGNFAFVIVAASTLGVTGFGSYSLAVFYFELFLSLIATAAGILLTRDVSRWPRRTEQLTAAGSLLAFVLAVAGILLLCGISAVADYSAVTANAIRVASLGLFPASICVVLEAVFVAMERAEFVTIGTTIESVLRVLLSFAALQAGFGILALMVTVVAVRCLMLFVYLVALLRVRGFRWNFSRRQTVRFARRWRVFAAENWMATIYTNLDVLILSSFAGEVAVGLYSAAWKVVRLGAVLAKSYTTAVFPLMSKLHSSSADRFSSLYRQSIRAMCLLSIPVAVAVSVFADRIIGLLFTSEFEAAIPILRVLIWVLLIEILNPFLSHALFAQGKQSRSMQVAGISLAFNLFITMLLVYRFGAVGAAAGTVASGLLATLCYMRFLMPGDELRHTLLVTAKIVIAAIGSGIVLYLMQRYPLPVIGAVAASVYVVLLFAVQAIRLADIESFRAVLRARVSQTQ